MGNMVAVNMFIMVPGDNDKDGHEYDKDTLAAPFASST